MSLVFYKCPENGEILMAMKKACPACLENDDSVLKPNTTDAAQEKHVPVVEKKDGELHVQVGSVEHPMLENHYIQFIALETKDGVKVKYLKPGEKPVAVFSDCGEPVAVYEYCNLHGLWKADL